MSKSSSFFAVLAASLLCLSAPSACTSAPESKENSSELVGKPPAQSEDPFAVRIRPSQAVPVAPRGTIEATEPAPAPAGPAMVLPATPESEQSATEQPEGPADQTRAQCFSCVRICQVDRSPQECEAAQGDVICGWGAAERAEEAEGVAQAQCDHALEMARAAPQWSEISGTCPRATCR